MNTIIRLTGAAACVAALVAAPTAQAADGRESSARGELSAYYKTGLQRTADPQGFLHFSRVLGRVGCANGLRASAVSIVGGAEFRTRYGNSSAAMVDRLYLAVLNRAADSGGRANWIARYNATARDAAAWRGIVSTFTTYDEAAAQRARACRGPLPTFIGLGDSYQSGVGLDNYGPSQADRDCLRSPTAYGPNVALLSGFRFKGAACTGAKTGAQSDPAAKDLLVGQIGQVEALDTLVTVGIGGNDIGFADIAKQCSYPAIIPDSCFGDLDRAEAFIRNDLPARLDRVYAEIRRRAPSAWVIVVGYPQLFAEKECAGAARTSVGEQRRINEVTRLAVATIRQRATRLPGSATARPGFSFVDLIPSFLGHAVCEEPNSYIRGVSLKSDFPPAATEESLHPSQAGHTDGITPYVNAEVVRVAGG